MAREIVTAEKALVYMNFIFVVESDASKMITISPESVAVNDEEEIDVSITSYYRVETCRDSEIRGTAVTIEILANICEENTKPPKWVKM